MSRARRIAALVGRSVDAINGIGGVVAGLAIAFSMLAICYEVVMRYIFVHPTTWVNEASEYLLVFSTFAAAGYILRAQGHVMVDLVVNSLNSRVRELLSVVTSCLALSFCSVVTWQGLAWVVRSYYGGYASSTLFRIPLWIPQSLIPIGFSFISLQFAVRIGRRIWSRPK